MITIRTISNGTRLRSNHNTDSSVVNTYNGGVEFSGKESWTSPSDNYNSSGIMINKAGDRWLLATSMNGTALPFSGWIAITHKGSPISTIISEITDVITDDPYVKAILITASGKEEIWLPQA